MAKVDLNTIKNWFKTGFKPTQAQFWNTWDSFWHKDDAISIDAVTDLQVNLDNKLDKANAGLFKIGDYMVDRRGGNNGTIKTGNIIYGVGSFLPSEYIIAIALIDDPEDINDFNVIHQYLL